MIHDCIYQRTRIVAYSRVYNHAFRLIYDQNIIIFIYYFQRNIFSFDIQLLRFRYYYSHFLPRFHLEFFALAYFPIYTDSPISYQFLQEAA